MAFDKSHGLPTPNLSELSDSNLQIEQSIKAKVNSKEKGKNKLNALKAWWKKIDLKSANTDSQSLNIIY